MKRLLLLSSLMLVSCNSLGTLSEVVALADIAVNTVAAVDPAVPGVALAGKYLNALAAGDNCAVAERSSGDSNAEQDLKIAACYSNAIEPQLPPGTPQLVATAITNVANALAQYLANLASPPVTTSAKAVGTAKDPSKYDGASLKKIKSVCEKTWSKLPKS